MEGEGYDPLDNSPMLAGLTSRMTVKAVQGLPEVSYGVKDLLKK